MARLSAERWREVIPHLDRALDLEKHERAAWLGALRATDATLADDLAALLHRHDAMDDRFLGGAPPPPPASLAGLVLGAYTLREQIGQGGMGSVWLAERSDGRYAGTAAVKLLNASLVGRDGEARFRREGRILARLRHPHIAQLIDAGVSPLGQPYLVLERVDGERIDRHCDARRLDVEARLRLFLDVLSAVAHAHANLVVHRDIKPSNVMVDGAFRVKLLDFGIAKLMEGEGGGETTALTRDGESALTPEYAAPEQLTGGDVTTATDVYALGVLLYVLLTGRHPAGAATASAAELVQAIVGSEATRPSDAVTLIVPDVTAEQIARRRGSTPARLRRQLRGDLDTIVGKALKKQPGGRYASAEAMADDLRRYLDRRPIAARPDSLAYRARKFAARNALVLAAAATAAAALVAGAGIAVRQGREAARERDRALSELHRAEAVNDLTSYLLSEATPAAGRPISNADLLARGEALVDRRFAGSPDLRAHMLLELSERYHQNGQFDRWQETVSRAFTVSRGITDPGLRARAACVKAAALDDEGNVAEADALLAAGLAELAGRAGAEAAEAYCRVCEANMANRRADAPRAVAAAERAVALEEGRAGPAGRGFEARFLLANAYLVAGRSADSDRAFRQVVEMLDAQGRGDTRDAALVLNNWSTMLQNAGQHRRAVALSERAVHIARARDTEHGAAPVLLRSYASALCMVGRCAEAVPVVDEAVAKSAAAGSARRRYGALGTAAGVHTAAGGLDRADELLREAERLFESARAEMPGQQAVLDRRRAELLLRRGDAQGALAVARRAAARGEDLRGDDLAALQVALVRAEAENGTGAFAEARDTARAAVARAAPPDGLAHSSWAGQAHLQLGIALAGLGAGEQAASELRLALAHLGETLGPAAPATIRARVLAERSAGTTATR